jgi:hypothetical protein
MKCVSGVFHLGLLCNTFWREYASPLHTPQAKLRICDDTVHNSLDFDVVAGLGMYDILYAVGIFARSAWAGRRGKDAFANTTDTGVVR